MIEIIPGICVDESVVEERFVRAPGPGGQNVNKVATAVQLRFDARRARLPPDVEQRLAAVAGTLMTRDGVLIIQASRFRTQARNREDARERLCALLRKAATRPKPRIRTKPSRAAKERRLEAKQLRSRTKQQRSMKPSRGEP